MNSNSSETSTRATCVHCGETILRNSEGDWFSRGDRVGGLTRPTSECKSGPNRTHRPPADESRKADKNVCGTCRTRTADGKPVEHEECAARAQLIEAPDAPGYEALTDMTMEEKAALPARFHIPVFDDCGSPKLWLCAVCWGDCIVTQWPCATAVKHGTQVFTR